MLLSSVDGTVTDAFTLFPRSLFGLAVLDLGAWFGIFESAHSHTLLQIIVTCIMDKQHKNIYILITSIYSTCGGWTDSLILTVLSGTGKIMDIYL
jgi:hypothetical protein